MEALHASLERSPRGKPQVAEAGKLCAPVPRKPARKAPQEAAPETAPTRAARKK